ncbi:hypothetical protein ACVXZY_11585 [Staphylococcus aureus]
MEQDESITSVLTKEELDECFDPKHHLNQVRHYFRTRWISIKLNKVTIQI